MTALHVLPPEPPACVGNFEEEHEICNGNPKGKTDFDRRACLWRDRCVALQAYASEFELEPAAIVEGQDPASLARMCDENVIRYSVKDGAIGALPPGEEPTLPPIPEDDPDAAVPDEPGDVLAAEGKTSSRSAPTKTRRTPKRRKAGERPSSRYTVPLNEEVLELARHFERQLRKHFREHRVRAQRSKRVLARPGTIYAIDRTSTARYVSWYQLSKRGRDQALACIRFKPALGCVDVEVPVSASALREVCNGRDFKALRVRSLGEGHGQFRAVCTHLDTYGTALIVETLARLVKHGKIKLYRGE